MKTNDIKKGTRILLRNGWEATIEDNAKGNTRMCTVYGHFTEMGSVYSHDIVAVKIKTGDSDVWHRDIEYTPAQIKCRDMAKAMGF